MDIYESYAILVRPGKSYGNCLYDMPAPSCPMTKVLFRLRKNDENLAIHDNFQFEISPSETYSKLALNVTFSQPVLPHQIEVS